MAIASMTGFGRAEGQTENFAWVWELRSVNGKGLDVRCRLPNGFESLEQASREKVAGTLKRGNISLTLSVDRQALATSVRLNTVVLDQILALLPEIQRRLPEATPPSIERLLALRGVIDLVDDEPDAEARAALDAVLLAGLARALEALRAMRSEEGARLIPVLNDHLRRIGELCTRAEALAATQPAAIALRLRQQLASVRDAVPAVSEDRLAQEVALLAAKADAREEIDRLKAHRNAAEALLAGDGPIGRRLDFLCQEFNREANTLCSKSSDVELTAIGVDLKAAIEQFREQVQNIE